MIKTVVQDKETLRQQLLLLNKELFAWDTETNSMKEENKDFQIKYELRYDSHFITGCSFCDGNIAFYAVINSPKNTNNIKSIEPEDFFNVLNELIPSWKNLRNIAHNWVYDARVFAKYGVDVSWSKPFDTQVAAHLLSETRPKGLKDLTEKVLKRDVIRFKEVENNHYHEKFFEYGMADAINTWDLYKTFRPQLTEEKLDYLMFKVEMPFQRILLEMALEGVVIDKDVMNKITDKVAKAEQDFIAEMLEFTNTKYEVQFMLNNVGIRIASPVNFGSPIQLRDYLFNKVGLKPCGIKTKTGGDVTGKELIESYIIGKNEDGSTKYSHPFIPIYSKYKISSKIHSMYKSLPYHIQEDGKLRSNFKDTGTKTGRLSSSSINLQQLPKAKADYPINVREVFTVPKGHKMFSVDYSGQEVAVMAQQSRDPTLVKSLNNGYDMHLAVANTFYKLGIPDEALSKKHPDYDSYKDKHSKARSTAKCFHPDTEVLTKKGWKRIVDIDENTEVVQAVPKNGECELEWARPTEVFTQYHDSKQLVHLKNNGIDLRVTPDHRMLGFRKNGKHEVCLPLDLNKFRYWCNAGTMKERDYGYSNIARFLVALQADGTITKSGAIRFGFTKQRKILRLKNLLDKLLISYTFTHQKSMDAFYINKEESSYFIKLLDNKMFTYDLLKYDKGFKRSLLDEIVHWDGHRPKNRKVVIYSSEHEQNVDVVQAIASTFGRKTFKRHNGELWVLSIKDSNRSRTGNLETSIIPYEDKVACLSVPSTFVLVRDKGVPVITGQTITFGLAYGKGAYGFAQDFRITEEEAQKLIDDYFAGMDKLKEAIDKAHKEVEATGIVTTLAGRKRHFDLGKDSPFWMVEKAKRQSFNFKIQSFSADMIRAAAINVDRRKQKHPEWGLKAVMTVHDEFVYQVKEEYVKEATAMVKKAFEDVCKKFVVPVNADVEIGENYGNAK